MLSDSVDYAKGETPMTDLQFKRYEELRDKCEEQSREIAALREEVAKIKEDNKRLKETQ